MLWKKAEVVPIKAESPKFLDELARQTGEDPSRMRTLLEEYAKERDSQPAPAVRRWSNLPTPSDTSKQEIQELTVRVEFLEKQMHMMLSGFAAMVESGQAGGPRSWRNLHQFPDT